MFRATQTIRGFPGPQSFAGLQRNN